MKNLAASLLVVSALGSPSLAQSHSTSATVSVSGTGLTQQCTPDNPYFPNPPGVPNVGSLGFATFNPVTSPGNPGYLVQSCGLSERISLIDSYAVTVIDKTNGHIGAGASSSATGGYGDGFAPDGAARATAGWMDTVYLNAPGLEFPDYLNVQFSLDGLIYAVYVDDGIGSPLNERVNSDFTVYSPNAGCLLGYGSYGQSGFGYTSQYCGNADSSLEFIDGTPAFEATIVDKLPLLSRDVDVASYLFSYLIDVNSTATSGYSGALLDRTLAPNAILLPDGSTPESRGWSLTFASGINSPNISVPPVESVPSPLPLVGVGAAFAWTRRIRRRIKGSLNNWT